MNEDWHLITRAKEVARQAAQIETEPGPVDDLASQLTTLAILVKELAECIDRMVL